MCNNFNLKLKLKTVSIRESSGWTRSFVHQLIGGVADSNVGVAVPAAVLIARDSYIWDTTSD